MIIPNAEKAFVDIRKLRDYALNPHHQVGKHKARLFAILFGIGMDDAEALRELILQAVKTHESTIEEKDDHGQRYRIEFVLAWRGRQATIRPVWNVRPNEDFPRLVTCYPTLG